jgi:hypothetical protein
MENKVLIKRNKKIFKSMWPADGSVTVKKKKPFSYPELLPVVPYRIQYIT